jgi:uncharacterized membrane protein YczE
VRQFLQPLADRPAQRVTRCVGGLALFGIGVALQKEGQMGLAPWDVFHEGFSQVLGWQFGRALVLTSFLVLLLWIPLRQRPGIGTLLNAVEIGVVADIAIAVLPEPETLWVRIPFMLIGVLLVGIGSGFYIGAGLGPGPRDGLMTGLAARGMKVSRARTSVELTVLLLGWILGGSVGVGTLVFALSIGPIVARTIPLLRLAPLDDAQPWGE